MPEGLDVEGQKTQDKPIEQPKSGEVVDPLCERIYWRIQGLFGKEKTPVREDILETLKSLNKVIICQETGDPGDPFFYKFARSTVINNYYNKFLADDRSIRKLCSLELEELIRLKAFLSDSQAKQAVYLITLAIMNKFLAFSSNADFKKQLSQLACQSYRDVVDMKKAEEENNEFAVPIDANAVLFFMLEQLGFTSETFYKMPPYLKVFVQNVVGEVFEAIKLIQPSVAVDKDTINGNLFVAFYDDKVDIII